MPQLGDGKRKHAREVEPDKWTGVKKGSRGKAKSGFDPIFRYSLRSLSLNPALGQRVRATCSCLPHQTKSSVPGLCCTLRLEISPGSKKEIDSYNCSAGRSFSAHYCPCF